MEEKRSKNNVEQTKGMFKRLLTLVSAFLLLLAGTFALRRWVGCSPIRDQLSTVATIVIALNVCAITTLTISISVQNNEYNGISLKDFYKLRGNRYPLIVEEILVFISFSLMLLIAAVCGCAELTLATTIMDVSLMVYVFVIELQTLLLSEKFFIRILRGCLKDEEKGRLDDEKMKILNRAQKDLMSKYTLKNVYGWEKRKDDVSFNRWLFLNLLLSLQDEIYDLPKIVDPFEREGRDRSAKENWSACYNYDLREFCASNEWLNEYFLILGRGFLALLENHNVSDEMARTLVACLLHLDETSSGLDLRKKYLRFVLVIFLQRIDAGDFRLLEALKGHNPVMMSYHSRSDNSYTFAALFLLTMRLYYLLSVHGIPGDIKAKAQSIAEKSELVNRVRYQPWLETYGRCLSLSRCDFTFLYGCFKLVDIWDYHNFNEKFVGVIDVFSFVKWFLANVLFLRSKIDIDPNDIDSELKSALGYVLNDLFMDGKKPKDNSTIISMCAFLSRTSVGSVFISPSTISSFLNLKNEMAASKMKAEANSNKINLKDAEKNIGNLLNKKIKRHPFNKDGAQGERLNFKMSVELRKDQVTESIEILVSEFTSQFLSEIRPAGTLVTKENYAKVRHSIENGNITQYSDGLKRVLNYILKDKKWADFSGFIKKRLPRKGGVKDVNYLVPYSLVLDDGIFFSTEMPKVHIRNLSEKEINEAAERRRRTDSLYEFEGVIESKERIAELIGERSVICEMSLAFRKHYADGKLFTFKSEIDFDNSEEEKGSEADCHDA